MSRRGQPRHAEYHLKCTKANSYRPAPSAPERGAAAAAAEGCGKRLRFCQGLGESVQSTTHILRIRLRFYKTSTAYRETPQSGPLGLPAPLSGALFSLPPWGWCSAQRIKIVMIAGGNHTSASCRAAAKGVTLVFLSRCHSSNDTPSVSPYGLPAPPSGSRVQPPLKGEDGASRRRGFRRDAEYRFECAKANSQRPLLPPLGEVPRSGKGGDVGWLRAVHVTT